MFTTTKVTALAAGVLIGASAHAANLTVGVVTSLSGPGAGLGVPYAKGIRAAQAYRSAVGDRKIRVIDAARRAGADGKEPGTPAFREALRDAIAQTRELAGTHGVFNFRPGDPYGLDRRSAVVIRLEKRHWELVP